MNIETICLLDELAANAWPALVQQQLEDWRLRAAGSVTRRANSVLTHAPIPSYSGWLQDVEDFYLRYNLPARFQISDGSPPALDPLLETHGYITEAQTSVQIAQTATVLERATPSGGYAIFISQQPDAAWLDAFLTIEGFHASKWEIYHHIFSAIGPRTCFALIRLDGEMVGVGMAVSERNWSGLFSIATAAKHRRKGIATQIVHALAGWSRQQNAPNLYLQVMQSNHAAINLYERLGFSLLYNYHFRYKVSGP